MIAKDSDNLSNSSLSAWRPGQGWLGVIPGKTSIKDAINGLGGTCETAEMANGFSFDFMDGLIRVTAIEQQATISKLWISGRLASAGIIPGSLKSAQNVFSNLLRVGRDPFNADIYESEGVRLAAASGSDDGDLVWIEFLPV